MHEAVIMLLATTAAVVVFTRLGLPAVLAYLVVGVLTGPHALNLLHSSEIIHLLGEIGIAFLLFSIGLEFSFTRLWQMRATLLGLGSIQVVLGTLSGALLTHAMGLGWAAAIIAGGALALSSTAIVIKLLADQGEIDAPHGRLAVAILLFQDLAAVPFLVAIPIIGSASMDSLATALGIALFKGLLMIGVMLALGARLLPLMFNEVARHRNAELMTLTVLLVAMAAAAASHAVGLSLALGTFVAGMLLAESTFTRQIRHDIRPFRDILLGLFFITIGLQLDLPVIVDSAPWVLTLLVGVTLGKGLLITCMVRIMGRPWKLGAETGTVLGQGGEFGLALLILAVASNVIPEAEASVVIAAITLSMFVAPTLISTAGRLFARITPRQAHPTNGDGRPSGHASGGDASVIIAGFGRTGHGVAQVLLQLNIPFIAIEGSAELVRQAIADGHHAMYGDATTPPTLTAAGIEQASAMVVTFDNAHAVREVLNTARELNPNLPIVVRARDHATLESLRLEGATDGVPETLESSLMLSLQLVNSMGVPFKEADDAIREVRAGHSPLIDSYQQSLRELPAEDGATAR